MSGDDRALEESVCREARYTVDHHITRIHNVDKKAVGIFRLNLLLIGALLTAVTIVLNVDNISVSPFLNIWSYGSVFFLVLSTFVASITYTSSSYDLGISPEIIEDVKSGEYDSREEFEKEVAELYQEWIVFNRSVGDFNSYLITIAIGAAFNGIVLLLGGGLFGLLEVENDPLLYTSFLFMVVALLILDYLIWAADGLYARFGGSY